MKIDKDTLLIEKPVIDPEIFEVGDLIKFDYLENINNYAIIAGITEDYLVVYEPNQKSGIKEDKLFISDFIDISNIEILNRAEEVVEQ